MSQETSPDTEWQEKLCMELNSVDQPFSGDGESVSISNFSPSYFPVPSSSYLIKEIDFRGNILPILCQDENGPCPLLAICNVLLLRQAIRLPSSKNEEFGEQRG